MKRYTLSDFNAQFPDEDSCLEFIKNARWPDGIHCVKCEYITPHHRIRGRKVYSCQHCGSHVSPTADTIFHKSSTSLRSWFHAMFLMASTRTGISAKQLERELGVTYKTAWRMFHQIRKLMAQGDLQLFGEVEVDETYIGGRRSGGPRGRGAPGKTVVAGIVQRNGKAVAKVVPDVKARTLLPMIRQHVPRGETVYTDELTSYSPLGIMGYQHATVRHHAKQYVAGRAHTNNIEGLWSNVKRGLDGVHHAVSPKYLQAYLDSYIYRFNRRQDEESMFAQLLAEIPAHV